MHHVSNEAQLIYNKDVKLMTVGTVQKMHKWLEQNPNTTYYAVAFCTTEWQVDENFSIPCQYSHDNGKEMIFYTLFFNQTLQDNGWLKQFTLP